jgi:hypothetical protein
MAQQTAVEYLLEKLYTEYRFEFSGTIVDKAKAMEKEQILNACYQFSDYPFNKEDHLEYYNETYKK